MNPLNKILLTGLSVLSLNKLYSQDKDYEKFSENLMHGTSLKQLIFDSWHPEHSKALEEYIPITKQEIQSDTSRFNILNPGLKEYLNKIYIIDEKDFFDSDANVMDGHTHPYGGIICLNKSNYTNQSVFHEAGHLRLGALDDFNSDFSKKWEQIANFEYGENNFYISKDKLMELAKFSGFPVWKDETIGPKNGCLQPMSGKSIPEDVANFVGCLGYWETPKGVKKTYDRQMERKNEILMDGNELSKLSLNLEVYQAFFPLFFADTTDQRYQKKLDLLKEYNFLTKEEHEKLSKNLGSLSYLLKSDENKK